MILFNKIIKIVNKIKIKIIDNFNNFKTKVQFIKNLIFNLI